MKKRQSRKVIHGPRRDVSFTLASLRRGHRLSQADLAERLTVSAGVVSRRERAGEQILVSTLREYASALGCECKIVFISKMGHRFIIDMSEESLVAEQKQPTPRPYDYAGAPTLAKSTTPARTRGAA